MPTQAPAPVAPGAGADVGVTPPRIAVVAAPGQTVTEVVRVASDSAREVRVSVGDWTLDPFGEVRFFPAGTLAHSASAWVTPETDVVEAAAGGFTDVRVDVRVPDEGGEGTYHAMVFFAVGDGRAPGRGIGVSALPRIGVAVYVTVLGTERGGAELIDLARQDGALAVVVANTGNTVMRLGGTIELRDDTGAAVRTLAVPDVPVLRDGERELTLPLPDDLEPGFYLALARIEDSRGGLLVGELPFEVGDR